MLDDYLRHVSENHTKVSSSPKKYIRSDFDYCPYCGEEL